MACSDYDVLFEFWVEGQFIDGVMCFFLGGVSGPLLALIVGAAVGLSLYVATESTIVPVVAGLLVGSVFAAELPGSALSIGVIILLFMFAAVGYQLVLWIERGA